MGLGAGLLAEGAFQLYSGDFDGGRLVGAGLVGALGGSATRVPGLGKYAAQAVLGAAATTLDGQVDVGAMVLGGFFGVGAEGLGRAATSQFVSEGIDGVRTQLFGHFDTMIDAGRSAEDAIAAAMLFDNLVSEHSRGAIAGGAVGFVFEKLQEGR